MLRPFDYLPEAHKIDIGPYWGGMFPWELRWIISYLKQQTRGNILEIGTFYGQTARELATHLPDRKIICVDYIGTDEYTSLTIDTVCKYARHLPNVDLRLGNSKDFIYDPKDDISVIIIDADHSWEGVKADTQKALDYLKGRHGTIIWHDYEPSYEIHSYLQWLYDHGLLIYFVKGTTLAFYNC